MMEVNPEGDSDDEEESDGETAQSSNPAEKKDQ